MQNSVSPHTDFISSTKLFEKFNNFIEKDTQPILRLFAGPQNANIDGIIFGGWLMGQVDIAASILARFFSEGRVVTKAVNSFVFDHPINIGSLLSFYGKITHIGNTSMTIIISVYSQNQKNFHEIINVAKATLVFVSVDKLGKKRKLQKN